MNWFETALLTGFVCFIAVFVWLNHWWSLRAGVGLNRRWYVEAVLKWSATIVNVLLIIVGLTVYDEPRSAWDQFVTLSTLTLLITAMWSSPYNTEIRGLAVIWPFFMSVIANPNAFVHFVSHTRPEGHMPSEHLSQPLLPSGLLYFLCWFGFNVLVVVLSGRKKEYESESCVRL
jgi:hypothetical protein